VSVGCCGIPHFVTNQARAAEAREEALLLDIKKQRRKSGQAMVEFCIGLVGLIAVVGGTFILKDLCLSRVDARVQATEEASRRGIGATMPDVIPIYNFIRQVDEGGDGQEYSQDDGQTPGGTIETFFVLNAPNQSGILRSYAPDNLMANIQTSDDLEAYTSFVSGQEFIRVNIRDFPVIQKMFVNQESVTIEETVWTVRTGDFY
jgi:hypothetical protein